MPRQKTSKAKVFGMRLNPITSEIDAQVMRAIEYWSGQGYSFKQLACDRILRVEGFTPEMFSNEYRQPALTEQSVRELLKDFALDVLQLARDEGILGAPRPGSPHAQSDEEFIGERLSLFASSIQKRQELGRGKLRLNDYEED